MLNVGHSLPLSLAVVQKEKLTDILAIEWGQLLASRR